jgi:hypothetical protein
VIVVSRELIPRRGRRARWSGAEDFGLFFHQKRVKEIEKWQFQRADPSVMK